MYKNKKNIFTILLIFIIVIYYNILKFKNKNKKTNKSIELFQSQSQPIIYILGEKEKYYCFEDYINTFINL